MVSVLSNHWLPIEPVHAVAPAVPTVVGVLAEPVRVLIWAWFLGALVVYAYRFYVRVSKPKPGPGEAELPLIGVTPPSFTKRLFGAPPALPPEPIREGSLVEAVIREELAAQGRLPAEATDKSDGPLPPPPGDSSSPKDGSVRSGLFAGAAAPTARLPVHEALTGIVLPDGLTPLSSLGDGEPGDHRVAFIAGRADAATTGRQVGDELERLGYTLQSTSDTTLDARRADAVVSVELHPHPEATVRDGVRSFPTARVGDVVVEFTT